MAFTSFDDLIKRDAPTFITGFGENEQAIYRPQAEGETPGDPRLITVIVNRDAPQLVRQGERGSTNSLVIHVANDSTIGISSEEFDCGVDSIDIAVEYGGPLLNRMFSQERGRTDAGMLILKVM